MGSFTFVIAFLLFIFGSSLQSADSFSLKMQPEHYLYINPENTPEVNILCILQDTAGKAVPIAGCGYKLYYEECSMEFNEGSSSSNYTCSERDWVRTKLTGKYQGRGLENGECGITFGGYGRRGVYILGCRVRPAPSGVWQYATTMIRARIESPMQYHLEQPGVTLAQAGSEVRLKGKAEYALYMCGFDLPPVSNLVTLYFHASAHYSLGSYHGAGMANKECGITLHNVQPESSGFVKGWVQSRSPFSISADFMQLIVITPPESPPLLTVLTHGVLNHGDILEATCLVANSRPAANITWFVGNYELRSGISVDGTLDSEWRWDHDLQSVQKRLRLRVTFSDDGNRLICRAEHLAFPSGYQNSESYNLHVIASLDPCTPNPCRGYHTECRIEGEAAVCRCQEPHVGYPPWCRQECAVNTDCSQYRTCVASRCVDLCLPETCGQGAECHVAHRAAVCRCPEGYFGDPHDLCEEDNCGRRTVNPQLLAGGQNANYGEFPWHAGIYQRVTLTDNTTRFAQICGGTLIKADIVITAAHCVYDQGYHIVYPKENYGVALGKILRDWYADLDIDDVQRMNVDDIHVHREFRGDEYDFRYDVAILKLSSSAVMTSRVQVACVDWRNTFDQLQLAAGNMGTVTGFGKTNVGPGPSRKLQWLDLPWVDVETCRAATHLRQRKYLSHDKFCAGYVDQGMSVCAGDSGGGLLFLNATSDRFYLRGVVSTGLAYNVQKLSCTSDHFTLFTKLSDFVSWIRKYVSSDNMR